MTTETTTEVTTPALPTPVVAPAAAQVVAADPAKVEAKPDAAAAEARNVVEYEPIENDPGLTMALQFIGKQGIGPDSPEVQAALKGDFSFLRATLAAKGATGSDHFIALAEKSWEKHVAESAENQTKTTQVIHSAVGGEEQWQAIQKWAGENADPEEKTAINSMLNAGGLQARAAAVLLQQMHSAAAGTVVEPAAATAAAVPANAGAAPGGALSPVEYAKEVAALVNKLGAIGAGRSKEMDVLRTRRGQHRG